MPPSTSQYLTLSQAAEVMACSTTHVLSLITKGKLTGYTIQLGSRKQWRTTREAIDAFMQANCNEATTKPKRGRSVLRFIGTKLDRLG